VAARKASKKPIAIKKSTQGSYTARAKANGNTPKQQARVDLAPGSKATEATKKKARFVQNIAGKGGSKKSK
jgi:hypothetical protein